jgi:hypothetical protein
MLSFPPHSKLTFFSPFPQFSYELEASYSQPPPVRLDFNPDHPTPASLIPGFEDEDDDPILDIIDAEARIGPVPYYQHVDYHPRATPVEVGKLRTFPFCPRTWENAQETNELVKQLVDDKLKFDDALDDASKGKERVEAENIEGMIELESFDAPHPARTFFFPDPSLCLSHVCLLLLSQVR